MRKPSAFLLGFVCLAAASQSVAQESPLPFTRADELGEILGSSGSENLGPVRETLSGVQRENYDFLTPEFSSSAARIPTESAMPTRSVRDAAIYREAAPSVVLIFAGDGLGSGSIISENRILTNWHVIAGSTDVGVVFKPEQEGVPPSRSDIKRGTVVKWDEVADLALIEITEIPEGRLLLPFGDVDAIAVGLDVYAIGHPDGQSWSYTKGIISQYRVNYEWEYAEENLLHRGSVIQTQTPINPGNSGGPLLDENGHIVGVNTFGGGGEGLNFAVAIDEIEAFLARPGNRSAKEIPAAQNICTSRLLSKERTPQNDALLEGYDTDCDGVIDAALRVPDDLGEPLELALDRDGDNEADGWVYDREHDDKWDISFWDDDFNGEPELVGHHVDGGSTPTEFESYAVWEQRVAAN